MARIQMTPMVKFALYFLRIYLIVLLTLLLVKFIKVRAANEPLLPQSPPAEVQKQP